MGASFLTLNDTVEGVGVFPQHQRMTHGYDKTSPSSVSNLPIYGMVDIEPNLDGFVLEPKAMQTDLISSASLVAAHLISSRFAQLLERFNLGPHAFFAARVVQRGEDIPAGYKLLHLPHWNVVREEHSPNEASEAISQVAPEVDLFAVHRPSAIAATYVSPRLAEAIEAERLTGIRLGRGKLRITESSSAGEPSA